MNSIDDLEAGWFAAGRFEELLGWHVGRTLGCRREEAGEFTATGYQRDLPDSHFAYGRALVLTEQTVDGGEWIIRAAGARPGNDNYRVMALCLAGDATVIPILEQEVAGATVVDWLAMAILLAEHSMIPAALGIVDRHLACGPARVPCRIVRLLGKWADRSPQVASRIGQLAELYPSEQFASEMVIVLRRLAEREDLAAIRELSKAWVQFKSDAFSTALNAITRDYDDLRHFADVPMIGESLAEMRLARMKRKLSVLLGMDANAVTDDMPRFVRLVPISENAQREWETLKARKG